MGLRELSLEGLANLTAEGLQHLRHLNQVTSISLELCGKLCGLKHLQGEPQVFHAIFNLSGLAVHEMHETGCRTQIL